VADQPAGFLPILSLALLPKPALLTGMFKLMPLWFWFIVTAIISLFLGLGIGVSIPHQNHSANQSVKEKAVLEKDKTNINNPGPMASFAAPDFFLAYEKNELGTDVQYKDKAIQIHGEVTNLQTDSSGRYYVGFKCIELTASSQAALNRMSPQERKWVREGAPPNVLGYISSDAIQNFSKVEPGAGIRIIGRCKGRKPDPNVWKGYVVILEECLLVN
jgi:hypothetical protein